MARFFKEPFLRPRLRRALGRMAKEGGFNATEVKAIKSILKDGDAIKLLERDIDGLAKFQAADNVSLSKSLNAGERPILDWLWNNRESILAFILKIIGMLS